MDNDTNISYRNYTVFINCSHSNDFRDVRHLLTLAVIASGHRPISNFDCPDLTTVSIQNLHETVSLSRYSLHECSCCTGQDPNESARYNLPLELGMSFFERERTQKDKSVAWHDLFLMVKKEHPYSQFIKTLNPTKVSCYSSTNELLQRVFTWLCDKETCTMKPDIKDIEKIWENFREKIEKEESKNLSHTNQLSQREVEKILFELCQNQEWWKSQAWFLYDVFISYRSEDWNDDLEKIVTKLKSSNLKVWIDKGILAGKFVQEEIEKGINESKAAAIFFGKNGIGKWQKKEIFALIQKSIEKDIALIPVILPGVDEHQGMPVFLRLFNYVKFSDINETDAFNRLIYGIRGVRP